MLDNYFERIRECYNIGNSQLIEQSLIPLLEEIKSEDFPESKFKYHPLGFIYAKLHEYSNQDVLRIHIWSNKSMKQRPLMDVHNHYYNVNSYVLVGRVSNTRYRLLSTDNYSHSIFEGSYRDDDRRVLTRTSDKKALEIVDSEIIEAGNLYRISKEEIHSGSADSEFAITLVFNNDAGNPNPLVFGPISGEPQYEYTSDSVDEDYVKELKNLIPIPEENKL